MSLVQSIKVYKEIVGNPFVTSAELAEVVDFISPLHHFFWKDEERLIAEGLARHPGCPPRSFAELLFTCSQAAGENPAWDLLMLENVLSQSSRRLSWQLKEAPLHPRYLMALAHHPNAFIRETAREHVDFAGEVEGDLREALQTKLLSLKRDSRLTWLARFGALPDGLNALLPHPIRPAPRHELDGMVLESDPQAFLNYIEHRTEFLNRCAFSKGGLVLVLAGMHLDPGYGLLDPGEGLGSLSNHLNWRRRLGAALNPNAQLHIVGYDLANDGNRWVRAVAQQRLADPSWRLF